MNALILAASGMPSTSGLIQLFVSDDAMTTKPVSTLIVAALLLLALCLLCACTTVEEDGVRTTRFDAGAATEGVRILTDAYRQYQQPEYQQTLYDIYGQPYQSQAP